MDRKEFNSSSDRASPNIFTLEENEIDSLRSGIIDKIEGGQLVDIAELVRLVKKDQELAGLVKDLVGSSRVDERELVSQVAREIVSDIENYVDQHLKSYHKFTLDAASIRLREGETTGQFFNLIGLLKDVSILGRRLLESAPQFNVGRRASSPSLSKKSSDQSVNKAGCSSLADHDDATSEDRLAALIESSSTDDYLVLSSSVETITVREMMIAALIYIKSNECFTLAHDIQDVALVLKRTKFMILNILAPRNQMELIILLLTSIGRYSVMNYVFDLFRDRNQFEILLSKGVEKTPALRIALFNYVKKNPEFYPMVTLNFSMFREIADSLKASALKRLDEIILAKQEKQNGQRQQRRRRVSQRLRPVASQSALSMSISNNSAATASSSSSAQTFLSASYSMSSQLAARQQQQQQQQASPEETGGSTGDFMAAMANQVEQLEPLYPVDSLNLSLLELIDASDCFAKADCYELSEHCQRKAKLVALQMALIATGTKCPDILDVTPVSDLNDLIMSFDSFQEAYILAKAYDYRLPWHQALFKHVILAGNLDYLADYCDHQGHLSSSLIEEIVVLYRRYVGGGGGQSPNKSVAQQQLTGNMDMTAINKAMRALLAKLEDVEVKCKIYSQLNFDHNDDKQLTDPIIKGHLRDLRLI